MWMKLLLQVQRKQEGKMICHNFLSVLIQDCAAASVCSSIIQRSNDFLIWIQWKERGASTQLHDIWLYVQFSTKAHLSLTWNWISFFFCLWLENRTPFLFPSLLGCVVVTLSTNHSPAWDWFKNNKWRKLTVEALWCISAANTCVYIRQLQLKLSSCIPESKTLTSERRQITLDHI